MSKKHFCSFPLVVKKGKENFHRAVKKSLQIVRAEQARQFSGRARRYLMAYLHFANMLHDGELASYSEEIEKFMKKCKVHLNILDQEKGWVSKVWMEAMMGGAAD
jgi:hypothetical protein